MRQDSQRPERPLLDGKGTWLSSANGQRQKFETARIHAQAMPYC